MGRTSGPCNRSSRWFGLGRVPVTLVVGCALAHAAGGLAVTAAGGSLRLLLTYWGVDGREVVDVVLASAASFAIPGLAGAYVRPGDGAEPA